MRKALTVLFAITLLGLAASAWAEDLNNDGIVNDPELTPGVWTGPSEPMLTSETATFPVSTDTWTVASSPYWWHVGDNVLGNRTLASTSASHVDVHFVIDTSYLAPPAGFVNLEVRLNGTTVGNFTINPGEYVKDVAIDFPALTLSGSTSIQYWETNQVAGGYGSIVPNQSGSSTISFSGGGTPAEPATWGDIKTLYR